MKTLNTKSHRFEQELAAILKERASFKAEVMKKVPEVFSALEKKGAAALLDFAKKFDGFKGAVRDLKVSAKEINSALKQLSPKQAEAIRLAMKRIEKFHKLQKPKNHLLKEGKSYFEERWVPLSRVGLYIPGGKAPLASTVLMTAVPARIAGVKSIALATPAGPSGKIHPAILFAARLTGVTEIYKVGGSQAIAAFALGVGPIQKVDKIFGPGGPYVSAAKVFAQGQGLCGIDTLAGPSEVLIIADGSAPVQYPASDISAQLEHGPDSWAFLVSTSEKYISQVLAQRITPGENLIIITARDRKEMISLANRIAAEHLEVHLKNPEAAVKELTASPAIFIGPYSPVAAGDYIAGTNHSLPTAGRAAFDSPLGVWDFMKRQSLAKLDKTLAARLASPATTFAEMEGLFEHARSLRIRNIF
jgi:histidinol dehydrogenase